MPIPDNNGSVFSGCKDVLTDDILLHIFQQLDTLHDGTGTKYKMRLGAVCKNWHRLLKLDVAWSKINLILDYSSWEEQLKWLSRFRALPSLHVASPGAFFLSAFTRKAASALATVVQRLDVSSLSLVNIPPQVSSSSFANLRELSFCHHTNDLRLDFLGAFPCLETLSIRYLQSVTITGLNRLLPLRRLHLAQLAEEETLGMLQLWLEDLACLPHLIHITISGSRLRFYGLGDDELVCKAFGAPHVVSVATPRYIKIARRICQVLGFNRMYLEYHHGVEGPLGWPSLHTGFASLDQFCPHHWTQEEFQLDRQQQQADLLGGSV